MNSERYQDLMFRFIESVLYDIGPRESCSENEKRLGRRLIQEWNTLGLQTRTEPFTCNPKAFLGFIPFAAILYLIATILYWMAPLWAALVAATAAAVTIFELLRYRELVDPLFPTADGENVVGVWRPSGEVTRRVIVSAHQDSAYEFNLWFFLKNASVPIMVIGFAAPFVPLFGGLAKWLAGAGGVAHPFQVVGWICVGLYPIVGLNLFFHTYSVVPGAMDDLAGISVLYGLGQSLVDAAREGQPLTQQTEVVLLGASSEEAGLRGAKRYAEAHRVEHAAIPTFGVFVDGVYDERHLTVVYRELFTGVHHDPRLVAAVKSIAGERGWPIKEHMIPLGATDATAFRQAGVATVTLLCQDATKLVPNYHTRLDTIEWVRPQSLGVMLQLVTDVIGRIDTGRI